MADEGTQRTMLRDRRIWQEAELSWQPRDRTLVIAQGDDIVALSEDQWRALGLVLGRLNAGKRIEEEK